MSFYELDAQMPIRDGGLLDRLRQRIGGAVRAIQYARMLEAMSQLSDEHLKEIGLTRADIPRHARECVYETRN